MRPAWERGAVVAGASAGAMGLAEWTWTPEGRDARARVRPGARGRPALRGHPEDLVAGVIDQLAPGGIGYLGLDERTGILAEANGSGERRWTVTGPGAAWWFARGADEPVVARSGEVLHLPV